MRWLLLFFATPALLCDSCTRSSEVKTEAKTELRAEENVTQTVQTGPETITTTTEEYVFLEKETAPAGAVSTSANGEHIALVTAPHTAEVRTLPQTPILVKRTVVVDQRGPVIDTTVAAATTAVAAVAHSDATKASSVGLSWKFYAAGALAILLLAGAAYVLWHAKVFTL